MVSSDNVGSGTAEGASSGAEGRFSASALVRFDCEKGDMSGLPKTGDEVASPLITENDAARSNA